MLVVLLGAGIATFFLGGGSRLLPRYVLYAFAGSHLGNVERVEDLWSPRLVGALAALAAVPWLVPLAARRRKR